MKTRLVEQNTFKARSLASLFLFALMLTACSSSGRVPPPKVTETWSPPPETEGIAPLSCDEIGSLFTYDPQAPLDIQETNRRWEEGVTVIDLTYVSPMGGRVPATLIVPDGTGPFAGMLYQHGMPKTRKQMIPAGVVEKMTGKGNFRTIVVGNRADLILGSGNPLENLTVIKEPLGVMAAGRWYSAEQPAEWIKIPGSQKSTNGGLP